MLAHSLDPRKREKGWECWNSGTDIDERIRHFWSRSVFVPSEKSAADRLSDCLREISAGLVYVLHFPVGGVLEPDYTNDRLLDVLGAMNALDAGSDPSTVPYDAKDPRFKFATEIIAQYDGKRPAKAQIVHLNYDKLRRFLERHATEIPTMHRGQTTKINAKAFAAAFRRHWKELAEVDGADPEFIEELRGYL